MPSSLSSLKWHKFPIGTDGFVCLIDVMGSDTDIVQAARISFNKDNHEHDTLIFATLRKLYPQHSDRRDDMDEWDIDEVNAAFDEVTKDENTLLRYLMRNEHGTPFEMAEVKLMIQIPMDAWRQFVRHRTLNINEYSTRYTEAIDSMAKTPPDEWRLQATGNKQGSGGMLSDWPEGYTPMPNVVKHAKNPNFSHTMAFGIGDSSRPPTPGEYLASRENEFGIIAQDIYKERLGFGVAREQARKDLPLSTYTRAIVKCDVRNWLHFLGLRMDSHAQKEIRDFANVIGNEIIRPLFPLTWNAFVDYRLGSMSLSRLDIRLLQTINGNKDLDPEKVAELIFTNKRERQESLDKLTRLRFILDTPAV